MSQIDVSQINKREQTFEILQRRVSYVLFAGVTAIMLQSFFSLTLVGRIKNTVSNNDHFMRYSQMYLQFCCMLLTVFLLTYYVVKIVISANRRKINIPNFIQDNMILLPFAFMLIWALISTYKSPYFEKSLYGAGYINEGYFTVLQYAVIFLSAYAIRNEFRWAKSALLWIFIIQSGIICLVFTGIEITKYSIPSTLKCGVFNNPNHYGYYLAMSTTATFGALLYCKRKWQSLLALLLLPFNVFQLLACNTLGANIAYICGIAFLICAGLISKKLEWQRLVVACAVSGVVNFILEVSGRTKMWASYVDLFKDIKNLISPSVGSEGGEGDTSSAGTGRFGLWKRTVAVIKQVPWFGKGLDLYHANNIYDTSLDVAHNEYLTLPSNIGLPALAMYLGTIVSWFVRGVTARNRLKSYDLVIFATAFAYLVSAIFGNSFTYTYPYLMLFLALSMQKPRFKADKYKKLQESNSAENLLKI